MIPSDELRRLAEGPREGERPGGIGLIEVIVRTAGDVENILRRCQEVMRTVVEAAGEEWPSDSAWSHKLPGWCVRRCSSESDEEDAAWLAWWRELDDDARALADRERAWSLPDWLFWLQPDERQWYWWDGAVHDEHEARILVQVEGWPFAVGALEWLLHAAGADSITVVENPPR